MIFILIISSIFGCIKTEIIGGFVLPHGGLALDPSHFNTTNETAKSEAWKVHFAIRELGTKIRNLRPDIVFLSTPHGVADLKRFAFFLNPNGYGEAETDNCQCPPCCFNISVKIDTKTSSFLVDDLEKLHNITGISAYGPPYESEEAFPLKWGEVIPLYFINSTLSKVVILSVPSRRYSDEISMIPELLSLGSAIFRKLNRLPQRFAIVISSDLAHTHDPNGPYGYSDAAEPFDKACSKWARSLNSSSLLFEATQYVTKAQSCGYTGLIMLHGLLNEGNLTSWEPHLYVNYHPSYYGMMVASFLKKDTNK